MKTKTIFRPSAARNSSFRMLPAFSVLVLSASSALAQLTYDANTGTPGAQDGAGAGWNNSNINFWNGAANVVWSNGLADTAIFGAGGTGATVVVGTVNVGTIQFNSGTTTGYTLSTGSITLGSGITTNQNTLTSTVSALVTGTNGLAFAGVAGQIGTVSLTNNSNNYTGITTLSTGGRLNVGAANALGSNTGASASTLGTDYTQVNSGSTLAVGTSTSEAFLINGVGSSNGGALRLNGPTLNSLVRLGSDSRIEYNGSTSSVIAGNLDLGSNTATLNNAATSTLISGQITGATGSIAITNAGTAVYNITNANTYGGTTTFARTVGIGNDAALGTSTIVFNGGGIQSTDGTARTLSNRIGTIGASVAVTFGQTTTQTGTLTFTNTTDSSLGTTGHILTTNVNTSFANGFTGTGASITKNGAATLSLNGASTYTGATTVSAGTLLANNITGSGTGTGAVNVTTATLGGNGTIGGTAGATSAVTINNLATLSPGNSAVAGGIGNLTIGSAVINRDTVFGAGSTLAIGVAGVNSDLLRMFGNLDLGTATDTLAITGTLDGITSYLIATYTGSLTGTFDNVSGLTGSYIVDYSTPNSIFLTIPEPSTAMLGGLALLLAFKRRR